MNPTEPTKLVPNRQTRRDVQRSKDPRHDSRLAAEPHGYTSANRQARLVCGASCAIPAGVHVSPMHLSRNEKTHDCDLDCFDGGGYVMQHAGVHRCRCGVSFEVAGERS